MVYTGNIRTQRGITAAFSGGSAEVFKLHIKLLKNILLLLALFNKTAPFFKLGNVCAYKKFAGAGIIGLRYFYGSINNVVSGMSGSGKFLTDPE